MRMDANELNLDGLIGPTHNYAGLSLGNVASAVNAGAVSSPRAAALQGLQKMRLLVRLGLPQGLLPPIERPDPRVLQSLGYTGHVDAMSAALWRDDPTLFAGLFSASSMWTANAATISPSADTADTRVHLSVANLAAMAHRCFEPAQTLALLRRAFADTARFSVHAPLAGGVHFGDEGAANHMRLAPHHGAAGVEVFVYGAADARLPARQKRRAGEAIARRHGLASERVLHLEQSAAAINAGAFHNDVVAVANERVLFLHGEAFTDQPEALEAIRVAAPFAQIIETSPDEVSLEAAVQSYLFNSQLLRLPDGALCLLAPNEAKERAEVATYLDRLLGAGALDRVEFVNLRESMRNGGGPACLRLRVALTGPELRSVDPRFLVDEAKLDRIGALVEAHWPERIAPADLGDPALWAQSRAARLALLDLLDLRSIADAEFPIERPAARLLLP
jgi:succinylarginine dihydrolase